MKTDVIEINNHSKGFQDAVEETEKAARYRALDPKESLQLQICAEEMLSLARSVTGEMNASFWVESQGKSFELHMTTQTIMDLDKRYQLLSSATSRKNELANSFLGKLRDVFEEAMTAETDRVYFDTPNFLLHDIPNQYAEGEEWDRYEQSILRKVADNVKISIRGGVVDMTVSKAFE